MRIAFQLDRMRTDGATRVFVNLGNQLLARGHTVYIVVMSAPKDLPFSFDCSVIEARKGTRNNHLRSVLSPLFLPRMTPRIDVAIGSSVPVAYSVYVTAVIRGARGVNFIQGDDIHLYDDGSVMRSRRMIRLYRLLARLSYKLPVKVIANSEWSAQRYREHRGRPVAGIIHPGVDSSVFSPRAGVKQEQRTVVTIGRRHAFKGLGDTLEALDFLKGKFDFQLIVISGEQVRVEKKDYPIMIIQPKDDMELSWLYNQADVFIQSSWSEGFGLPALEAMACGAPVVVTDSGGVREFARPGVNCVMVRPRDPLAIARAVAVLFDDKPMREGLANGGIETARRFSWEESGRRLEEILGED